jgi:hypothetical protein
VKAATIGLGALALVGLLARGADASPPSPSTAIGPTPSIASLPHSAVAPITAREVPKLRAGETAAGFHLETPPHGMPKVVFAHVAESAEAIARHMNGRQSGPAGRTACYELGFVNPGSRDGMQWAGGVSPLTSVHTQEGLPPSSLVRSRKLVVTGPTTARLETASAWVDARTLAARAHSRDSVALSLVRTLPGDIQLWAGRVGAEPDGPEQRVLWVMDRGEEKPEHQVVGVAFARHVSRTVGSNGPCPLVTELISSRGESDQITIQLDVVLDAREVDDDRRGMFGDAPRELRIRSMTVGLSTSWLPSEEAPMLGVAVGFVGRERLQAF